MGDRENCQRLIENNGGAGGECLGVGAEQRRAVETVMADAKPRLRLRVAA